MTIISQAPCRISLVGGGTDVNPFAFKFGGQVLSLAINLYYNVELSPRQDNQIFISALNQHRKLKLSDLPIAYHQDPDFDLLYAILNHFRPKFKSGFNLSVSTNAQSVLGLGSSAAAGVAVIQAINHWQNLKLTKAKIANLAYQMEVKELGWSGGKQDQYAASFGGINLITFGPKDKVLVKPINLSPNLLAKLKSHLLLFYLGGKRHSSKQQEKLIQGMSQEDKHQALLRLKASVDQAVISVSKADWNNLGKILDQSWQDKKQSNPAVTNSQIDKLYQLALDQGAFGGKIIGSGAAGHMFFLIPPEKHSSIIKAFAKENVKPVEFEIDFQGVGSHSVYIRPDFKPKKNWAVFFDRDGVLNKEVQFLSRIKDLKLIPKAIEAVKKLNQKNIPVIVVHNAAAVARNLCSQAMVEKINQSLIDGFAKKGAIIDALFYCPHHFDAYNPDFKLNCSWRKPKSGMLLTAADLFKLDLSKSFLLGDQERDIQAGQAVKAKTFLIKSGQDILSAVDKISL